MRCVTLVLAVVVSGCQANPAPAPAPAASSCPETALDGMDGRSAVPLVPMMANHQKQNMRDHLLAVQQIIAAAGEKDFGAIQQAASRIGYSEQMGMMCQHMGAGAPGFTDAALKFHHTADGISDAAKKQDLDGVMKSLASTLETCTNCHKQYKQRVVDDATWASLTKQAAPTSPMHPE
jgi:predicted kinase